MLNHYETAGENETCWSLPNGKYPLKISDSQVPVSTIPPVSHDEGSSTVTFWKIYLNVYKDMCLWKLTTLH
jgi:hypothetical protein